MSSTTNETDLAPLIDIVTQHAGIVLNGHDHCLGHYCVNNTNFILSGGAGYPQADDCSYGIPLGPYAQFLGANVLSAANGFVTMNISKQFVNFEYYLRGFVPYSV
ncbi:hypothetical protein K503DRAFT_787845 [Rhizopogon vinicolor AM-OR11-026]|uniref:Calcineurin-like phosphoesterase domain-containing protein n=1 Tax=Rhizopogon vinicolor AM-OR11-026 TaxID=1314800 RepID=A0A1B7MFP1_9AGAM|nr:hypothetical protein K503DRAFT_787845 [Rhizopogon vinicolor AM-OR11-026]